MRQFLNRLFMLIVGLALYGLGIVVTIQANIGYEPWDIFHVGLAKTTGLSIGTISILVGLLLVISVALLGEKLGLGTFLNMIMVGLFVDLFMNIGLIPLAGNFFLGTCMLLAGLFTIALATYFYIKSAFGAGPRDNLMVVLARRTGLPVGVCRGGVELIVTIAGWALGGMVGVGTVISVIVIGYFIQLVFRLFKFDIIAVKHETLGETLASLKSK